MLTGVLALGTFVEWQLALHAALAELAAARIESLLLDLRGNTGGDLCLIYDLAYLLSNHINSPEDAQVRVGMLRLIFSFLFLFFFIS
jgi:C-terminal processing protease CtpA/Prc